MTSTRLSFSTIRSESYYVLGNLEVETDYIVSVIAINECGDESQPSNITVRIDMNGMSCSACVIIYCAVGTGITMGA